VNLTHTAGPNADSNANANAENHEAPSSPEARIVAAESLTTVGPDDLDLPPVINNNPAAIDAYAAQGIADAASPGLDIHSPTPVHPSAGTVTEVAMTPMIRLGERFQAFHARHASGQLGRVAPLPVKALQILKGMWHYLAIMLLVLGSAVTVEIIYGSSAADLLARNTHDISVRAAVAATIVLNGGAWFFADLAHRANPHLARRRGLWIAFVGFLGIALVVTCLGLVIGGWDPLEITNVTGGGGNTTAEPTTDHRWLLTTTYVALVILATLVTAAGHYLVLDTYQTKYVNLTKTNEKTAEAASLNRAGQDALAAQLARSYLDAVPAAENHIRTRLNTYTAAFARHSSAELNDAMAPLTYTPITPLWAAQAQDLIGEHHRLGTGARRSA